MFTIPGKIPVVIYPTFFIMAALIGGLNSGANLWGILLWIIIILFSVVVHEYGHALTAYLLGQRPKIELVAMGGRTSYEGKSLSLPKQFLIVFDGPLFGFLLFLAAHFLLQASLFHSPVVVEFLRLMQLVNFFWTIVNLIPLLPLDGGQLLRIVLEFFFGVKGFKASLFIGLLIGSALGIFFFSQGNLFLGALFFFFAFESFALFRKSRILTLSDRKEEYAEELREAEKSLQRGDVNKAKELLQLIRKETKSGLIFTAATQYLALLYLEDKERKEAYDLLLSIKEGMEETLVPLLQELAFEQNNYSLVAELSSVAFQQKSTEEVALCNARAFAILGDAKSAGGWLATVVGFGKRHLDDVLLEKVFATVKEDPAFQHFFKHK